MGFLSFLGFGPDIKTLLRKGAIIIDVRNVNEYDQGRVRGSLNIPIDRLQTNIQRIKGLDKPIITCSTGDSRSSEAVKILKRLGVQQVYNGGSWEKLLQMINGQH
ncbi:MAG TPA: rhodanese-like domain-containing protein [Chitinophagaceae bacterium]|jgi:rhodanese-related sulfurtransferase|nr:rhodanese-like domain-containing protein [Chitinophagaceae bacterium]